MIIKSVKLDEIEDAMSEYINKCARVYIGIRASGFHNEWKEYKTVKEVEESIYELLNAAYHSIDHSQLKHCMVGEMRSSGIHVRVELNLKLDQRPFNLDPNEDIDYSVIDIMFVIVPPPHAFI